MEYVLTNQKLQKIKLFLHNGGLHTIRKKIPTPLGQYDKYHTERFYYAKSIQKNSFSVSKVSEDLALNVMRTMKANKGIGWDNLLAKFLKDGDEQVVQAHPHFKPVIRK